MTAPATNDVLLREVADEDLPVFFEQQLDPAANQMAAFTAKDPADRNAFDAHWTRLRSDDAVTIRTVLYGGRVAGHVASFVRLGHREVSYWLGRDFWGRGIATAALSAFLDQLATRPLYARVAKDNVASLRVLQKCGFSFAGEDTAFSHARGAEIEEYILALA